MLVQVDQTTNDPVVTLLEPDEVGSFALLVHGHPDAAALTRALGGLGTADADVRHAWLRIDGIRGLAGARARDPRWSRRFEGMVEYARGTGWVSPDGASIRAHVEST
jgi:hypothetical protein